MTNDAPKEVLLKLRDASGFSPPLLPSLKERMAAWLNAPVCLYPSYCLSSSLIVHQKRQLKTMTGTSCTPAILIGLWLLEEHG